MASVTALILLVAVMTIKQAMLDIVVGDANPSTNHQSLREASVHEETHPVDYQNLLATIKEMKRVYEEQRMEIEHLKSARLFEDCADLRRAGYAKNDHYTINPFDCGYRRPIQVYCDMKTDGGGYTLILKVNFNQSSSNENFLKEIMNPAFLSNKKYNARIDLFLENGETNTVTREIKRVLKGEDIHSEKMIFDEKSFAFTLGVSKDKSRPTSEENCFPSSEHSVMITGGDTGHVYIYKGSEWIPVLQENPLSGHDVFWDQTCFGNLIVTELSLMVRPQICDTTYKNFELPVGCYGGQCF